MSIFDKLKNTAQQAVTTAVQTAGSKRETFTFAVWESRSYHTVKSSAKCGNEPRSERI